MALFMERHLRLLKANIHVLAVPVVGDADYLTDQMAQLDRLTGNYGRLPMVLSPKEKRPFAKERAELLQLWQEMRRSGLELDLIYGARAWEILLDDTSNWTSSGTNCMYYHCGGTEGNESQLSRYRRAGLLS